MSSNPGITTAEDIRQRCHVTDQGCWVWRYARNSQNTPQAWFPARNMTTSVTSILHTVVRGREIPKGKLWRSTCGMLDCVNPEHQRYTTRSVVMAGKEKSPLHRIRIIEARRARSELSLAAIADIRDSTDTLVCAAKRHGCTRSTISRIRNGQSHAPIQPMSVFSNFGA